MDLTNYPDILLRREVSEVLKIGRYKTNELLFGGQIKVLKIGNSIRIRKKDLIDFMGSHSTRGKEGMYGTN